MKSSWSVFRKLGLLWLLVIALILLVADLPGIFAGNFSQDSYSRIRSEFLNTKNAKVLLVGSWDDFYSLEYNDYWRREGGGAFVERNYNEVLDAASMGNEFFSGYLKLKGFTHILVPRTTFDQGVIRHKFTNRGSIEIDLADPFFTTVGSSVGPFASVLLKVKDPVKQLSPLDEIKYDLSWKHTDLFFYTQQTKFSEVGLYNYTYSTFHEWGTDVSWFFDASPEKPNFLEIGFSSASKQLNRVNVQLILLPAYGPNAPQHVVEVVAKNYSETKTLSPNNPGVFSFKIQAGESVRINNVTPCRIPSVFEPTDLSIRKICFGVSKIFISPETQAQ